MVPVFVRELTGTQIMRACGLIALTLILSGGGAAAFTSEGREYDLSCNANGYVLRSQKQVSHSVERRGRTRTVTRRETLYLGRSCDAFHQLFRIGKWCWTERGFGADFIEKSYWFPDQNLVCPDDHPLNLRRDCRC